MGFEDSVEFDGSIFSDEVSASFAESDLEGFGGGVELGGVFEFGLFDDGGGGFAYAERGAFDEFGDLVFGEGEHPEFGEGDFVGTPEATSGEFFEVGGGFGVGVVGVEFDDEEGVDLGVFQFVFGDGRDEGLLVGVEDVFFDAF